MDYVTSMCKICISNELKISIYKRVYDIYFDNVRYDESKTKSNIYKLCIMIIFITVKKKISIKNAIFSLITNI